MHHTLNKLAKLVSGETLGSPATKITGVSEIFNAAEGSLVFVLEPAFLDKALESKATAIVAHKSTKLPEGTTAILVDNPRLALAKILSLFAKPCEVEPGIHKTAVIHKSAKISKTASIGSYTYIGPNVTVGDNTIIYPHVTVYADSAIGKNCIIHAGARIGLDGFGFVPVNGKFEKIPQTGKVIIEDDVEIYSNTCVARGTIGNTIIRRGTKIDTLSHIAHNCDIGEDCAITSLVGFAGSVTLKNHVTVGGQAGFSGHQSVGENTIIMARAGVTKDIPANSVVSGFPAVDHRKEMETQAVIRRLPKILKKLKDN